MIVKKFKSSDPFGVGSQLLIIDLERPRQWFGGDSRNIVGGRRTRGTQALKFLVYLPAEYVEDTFDDRASA